MLRDTMISLSFDVNKSPLDGVNQEMDGVIDSAKTMEGTVNNSTTSMSDKISNMGGKLKDTGSKMSGMFTAPIVGGLFAVTKGTEETQQSLARLEQNAENAGVGADTAREALSRLSGITGDTESNVEALSNIMSTGMDESGMLTTMEALSGAVTKFPDTLNIEGLSDGLQETLATGKAVGPFAEMLERLGFNLDTFDKGLQNAKQSGTEQQYVLENLANTGLAGVAQKYRENNKELVESRESSAQFTQAMADLGNTLTPVVTSLTSGISSLLTWFNSLSPAMQKVVFVSAGIAAAIGPFSFALSHVITLVPKLVNVFKTVSLFMKTSLIPTVWSFTSALLANPITWIVVAILGLIAVIVLLWKNWDQVSAFLSSSWDFIKAKASAIFSGIKSFISDAFTFIVRWIQVKWTQAKMWTVNTLQGIWQAVVTKFQNIVTSIREKMNSAWDTIQNIWGNVMDFLNGIDLFEIGKNIIGGLIKGIKNMAGSVVSAVGDIAGSIKDKVTGFFGIHSPARLMIGYGEDIGMGQAIGIENTKDDVEAASDKVNEGVYRGDVVRRGGRTTVQRFEGPRMEFNINGSPSNDDEKRIRRIAKKVNEEYWDSLSRRNPQVTEG